MKQASVLDLLASPTGRNVALLRVSQDRDLELLRHHLAPEPEAESWFSSDIVKCAAGRVPMPAAWVAHAMLYSADVRSFYPLESQRQRRATAHPETVGCCEVDRFSNCRLDAFKSPTREPEIASRARFQPCTSASGLRASSEIAL